MKNKLNELKCSLFGHRINRYLIETSNQKKCIRCGKTITVWDIVTIDELERQYKNNDL